MYPFARLAKELYVHRRKPRLPLDGVHVSHHVCWPWDLDMFVELNNGRTLTFFDLGRIPMAIRFGLIDVLKQQGWGFTVAGSSVRYRRRVRMFHRLEMHSRCVGWDDRFIYLEQSMWRRDHCTSQGLFRTAVTDRNGLVSTARVLAAMGRDATSPELPGWVAAWIGAEDQRIWPPAR